MTVLLKSSKSYKMFSATDWQGLIARFAYDRNDNLTEEIYPNSTRVAYAYDVADRLIDRHLLMTKFLNKSKFFKNANLDDLLKQAEKITPTLQENGNFQRIVDVGKTIGIDVTTGQPTSIYTVITDAVGNLITAHPGLPFNQ